MTTLANVDVPCVPFGQGNIPITNLTAIKINGQIFQYRFSGCPACGGTHNMLVLDGSHRTKWESALESEQINVQELTFEPENDPLDTRPPISDDDVTNFLIEINQGAS